MIIIINVLYNVIVHQVGHLPRDCYENSFSIIGENLIFFKYLNLLSALRN